LVYYRAQGQKALIYSFFVEKGKYFRPGYKYFRRHWKKMPVALNFSAFARKAAIRIRAFFAGCHGAGPWQPVDYFSLTLGLNSSMFDS
jgi:hypothetical protein